MKRRDGASWFGSIRVAFPVFNGPTATGRMKIRNVLLVLFIKLPASFSVKLGKH